MKKKDDTGKKKLASCEELENSFDSRSQVAESVCW